jgi:carbohydrate-selective porin OprB
MMYALRSRLLSAFPWMVAALILALPAVPQPAHAADEATAEDAKPAPKETFQEQFEEVWKRELLTGDWEGWRTALQEHGIDPHFRLSQYGQWVADGGRETAGGYGGTMDYRINADLRKLFGLWDGLSVSMHARSRWGQDVNKDAGEFALPNAGLIMPVPGNYTGTDVTGLVVSQNLPFFAGRLANITLGKLDVIDTVNGFFPDIVTFGQEGFWNINALVTALPWFGAVNGLGLYGGVLSTINQEFQMAESGFLVTGTQNVSDSWSSVQDSFDDGFWLAGYHRFLWKLEDKPGYFLLFAGGSTRDQPSNDPHDHVVIPGQGVLNTKEKKPWDIAMYLYQVFWQAENDPNRKATIFIGGTVGPDDPQFAQYHVFAALEAHGPMASRPLDRMGVSYWKNWLSGDFKNLVSPVANLRDLWGFEIYYNIAINKWLHLTPDLQFVKNENRGDDLAIIPGLRAVIDF